MDWRLLAIVAVAVLAGLWLCHQLNGQGVPIGTIVPSVNRNRSQ